MQTRTANQLQHYIQDDESGARLKELMSIDIDGVIIMSRSKKARIVEAFVAAATGGIRGKENDTLIDERNWWQRLFNKSIPPK